MNVTELTNFLSYVVNFYSVVNTNITKQVQSPDTICTTPSCIEASKYILKHLDESVNPCDDFYKFACGKYLKDVKLKSDELEFNKFVEIATLVSGQLQTAFEEPPHENDLRIFNLAKKFYRSCMDTKTMDRNGLRLAKSLIKSFGGWPAVEGEKWNESAFDWKETTYKFRQHGFPIGYFLNVYVSTSAKYSHISFITIDETHLITNRINLMNGFYNSMMISLYGFLVDSAVLYGADRDIARVDIEEALKFLMELGKITSTATEREDLAKYTHARRLGELQKSFPFINWVEYINNIIGIPQVQYSEYDVVNVANLEFLKKFDQLLKVTPKRVQANYAMAVLILNIGYALNKEARNLDAKLFKEIMKSDQSPRSKICLSLLTTKIDIATSALYVRKYFNEKSKIKVQKLMNGLQEELLHKLKNIDWMDNQTKVRAINKGKKIKWHVGYPDELKNDFVLNNYYKDLKAADDFFQFLINVEKFNMDKKFLRLSGTLSHSSWMQYTAAQQAGAYYLFGENAILLPAGILQDPIYNMERPKFMNFGGIGFIIGHELTHGFDYVGKQFSELNTLDDWWTKETTKLFLEKLNCFNNLYNNYSIPEINTHVNGFLTHNENIADNGGINLAYNAYQTWTKRNGQEQNLPNLKYSPNQLFWISTAITWCSKQTVQQLKNMQITKHAPNFIRVFGITSNVPIFSNDFNCSLGRRMNPYHKCPFW